MGVHYFGSFQLDEDARRLSHAGEPVPLTAKVFDTLLVLVRNHGRVLDKEELLSAIWPGTAVEEANLTQNVFTLRKVLGDNAKDGRYIATIPGRGYSFVAPVSDVPGQEFQSQPAEAISSSTAIATGRRSGIATVLPWLTLLLSPSRLWPFGWDRGWHCGIRALQIVLTRSPYSHFQIFRMILSRNSSLQESPSS
jgi:DNA-binding winged helix-turn-helix (wHTH) protein